MAGMNQTYTEIYPNLDIPACSLDAGIVGTGGAGFPMHVKIGAKAEIVIANGAECEPILETDRHFMLNHPDKVIKGVRLAMQATGATQGIIGIKSKHKDIIEIFEKLLKNGKNISLYPLQNFYPAGDEHVLVYETTGRVVPQGGIPIDVKVVVNNVFTLGLLADAAEKKPYTHKYITVTGEVNTPCVGEVPIGTSLGEVIDKLGHGAKISDYKMIIGGPMMGKVETDTSLPVTKTTGAIIVLPSDHKLIGMKTSDIRQDFNRAKSVCCQCNLCTDLCPRNLLGHKLYPAKSMRVLPFLMGNFQMESLAQAALCTDCGLCQMFACTMNLAPNRVNNYYKKIMSENNYRPDVKSQPMDAVGEFRSIRKVPTPRLIDRLGVYMYNNHLPFVNEKLVPATLELPLKMHIGAPCEPIVKVGDLVLEGQLIAKKPEDKLGTNLHAPCEGVVRKVADSIVIETIKGV